ncbi:MULTISPECIES: XRE family transcriptional regulator [unclassified Clostridium]|uniref:LexA family transcriptional regulator n=1 Tax=Clostridium sulfidigenes TaxID=318464 RepID=A0A927W4T9_9CLOT|nr:LexA family transcriptional regulator [Clostridium sulfidigenes]
MKKTLGEKITAAREAIGLSQYEVAEFIKNKGIDVTNQKVSKWETNYTTPNAYQFLALCEALKVSDVLGTFGDCSVDSPLSNLNQEGKNKVEEYITLLIASGMYSNEVKEEKVIYMRKLPLYDLPVSAGTGKYLDDNSCEIIEVGSDVPMEADFGVRISGDSMEPRFVDGQIVWIHKQDILEDGEIGVFAFENNSYCKKISICRDGIKLISLNEKYAPISVPRGVEFHCFGKVVE